MNKIVRAINAMISNASKITDVSMADGQYYFLYDGKHKWSITHLGDDDYTLAYYASPYSIGQIHTLRTAPGFSVEPVPYSLSDIGTREARDSFCDLYTTIRDKASGLNKVMDEIIGEEG
jgi:hypothetical protein